MDHPGLGTGAGVSAGAYDLQGLWLREGTGDLFRFFDNPGYAFLEVGVEGTEAPDASLLTERRLSGP